MVCPTAPPAAIASLPPLFTVAPPPPPVRARHLHASAPGQPGFPPLFVPCAPFFCPFFVLPCGRWRVAYGCVGALRCVWVCGCVGVWIVLCGGEVCTWSLTSFP